MPFGQERRYLNQMKKILCLALALIMLALPLVSCKKTPPAFEDIDFSTKKKQSKVYGNAKRYLMFSLYGLFGDEGGLSVTHPGITLTNITSHYPKLLYFFMKPVMKVIFMKPKSACLSIYRGLFEDTNKNEWIGPRIFNVWGKPKKQVLTTCSADEAMKICEIADEVYEKITKS